MNVFRAILLVCFSTILLYTLSVSSEYGWDFLPIFFDAVRAVTWAGQFHLDFLSYLLLTGVWTAWRHQFSPLGILLGVSCAVGGILVFAPYLIILSFRVQGDVLVLLTGRRLNN